jgi:hypothetical protein
MNRTAFLLSLLALFQLNNAQKFKGFGKAPFSTIVNIHHNDDTGYPNICNLQIANGKITLNGYYCFCSEDPAKRTALTANHYSFTCTPSKFVFVDPNFGEQNKYIDTLQSHYTTGIYAYNLLNTKSQNISFLVHQIDSPEDLSAYKNFVALKITASGKYILAQKFLSENGGSVANCILGQEPEQKHAYILKKLLEPQAYSTGVLINESWPNTIQNTKADYVFGYVFQPDSQIDELVAWDCQQDDDLLQPSLLVKDQTHFYECFAASKSNRYIIGAQHTVKKNLRQQAKQVGDIVYPFLLEADDKSLKPKILKYGVINKNVFQQHLVPGIANIMSPCGQILFGMHTLPDPYLQASTANSSSSSSSTVHIPDLVSRYIDQTQMGIVPKSFAKSIHATLCINRVEVFLPLKSTLALLLQTEKESKVELLSQNNIGDQSILQSEINDLEKQIEQLNQWHLIQVMAAEYSSFGELVFAGLGLNPQNEYELFYFQHDIQKLCDILNLNYKNE